VEGKGRKVEGKSAVDMLFMSIMYIMLQQRLDETDDLTPSLSHTQIHTNPHA
jgi:hypothetical protein